MDGFEPVGLTLAVVTVDDIQARSPKDFATKISKIIDCEGLDYHRQILTYYLCDRVSPDVIRHELKPLVRWNQHELR